MQIRTCSLAIYHGWLRAGLFCLTLGIYSIAGCSSQVFAADNVPVSSCQSLTSSVSDDKISQIFKATAAAAPNETIAGYVFAFGDNQSYTVTFGPSDSVAKRNQATVSHIYQQSGSFPVSVSVLVMSNGKQATVSSPACSMQIHIGDPASQLVNTGPGQLINIFVFASGVGCLVPLGYQLVKRSTRLV